jgi:hypothetical protein
MMMLSSSDVVCFEWSLSMPPNNPPALHDIALPKLDIDDISIWLFGSGEGVQIKIYRAVLVLRFWLSGGLPSHL